MLSAASPKHPPPSHRQASSNMAVIQDLPPEVLYRILELAVNDLRMGHGYARELRSAALVARPWTSIAQALLHQNLYLSSVRAVSRLERHLDAVGSVHMAEVYLQLVFVPPLGVSVVFEKLLGVRRLTLSQASYSAALLADSLLAGEGICAAALRPLADLSCADLEYLSLESTLTDSLPPTSGCAIPLGSLQLSGRANFSAPLLNSLLPRAQHLTHLALSCWPKPFLPKEVRLSFEVIAAQLRRLSVSDPPPPSNPAFASFLSSCTGLVTLKLQRTLSSNLVAYLSLLPTALVSLETLLGLQGRREADDEQLVLALDTPALHQLRRWRLSLDRLGYSMSVFPFYPRWKTKAAERGIELRDEHRHFTGESSPSWKSRHADTLLTRRLTPSPPRLSY